MKLLLACIGLHELLALVIPGVWLVPNLTLMGLVAATIRRPEAWPAYGCVAAVSLLPWLTPGALPLLVLYGAVGAGVAALAKRFDLQDARLQYGVAAAAASLVTYWMIVLERPGSWALLGWGLVQVALTVSAMTLLRLHRARER